MTCGSSSRTLSKTSSCAARTDRCGGGLRFETSQRGALLGKSEAMQRVRAMIEKVADTDATVLVRGESGTGKELVARELHDRSSTRSNGAFVAVNCAALPTELIESELFGHEKGAFTGAAGASKRKIRAGQWRHFVPR